MHNNLEKRVRNCREVIIQNVESTILHKMVYMYLKDRKIDQDIESFSLNNKKGLITIAFIDH